MKLSIKAFTLGSFATLFTCSSYLSAAVFLDDFSTDTSANYIYTSTYGADTAKWNVSGGKLNIPVKGGSGQTANLFHKTAKLGIGETVSVDISGPDDVCLSVSTTTRGANTTGEDGVRLNWKSDGSFRARCYKNGSVTNIDFDATFKVTHHLSLIHI